MWLGFTTTCATSAYHTKVVSSNLVHGEVYLIQHYAIKFVSDLRRTGGFCPGTPVSSTNKTDRHDMTEILLKMALSTINHQSICIMTFCQGKTYVP
jgi:hypothetical protein